MNDIIIKELVHIRCLLEGIWLDTKEAKEGTTLKNVEEKVKDEVNEINNKDDKKGLALPIRETTK